MASVAEKQEKKINYILTWFQGHVYNTYFTVREIKEGTEIGSDNHVRNLLKIMCNRGLIEEGVKRVKQRNGPFIKWRHIKVYAICEKSNE